MGAAVQLALPFAAPASRRSPLVAVLPPAAATPTRACPRCLAPLEEARDGDLCRCPRCRRIAWAWVIVARGRVLGAGRALPGRRPSGAQALVLEAPLPVEAYLRDVLPALGAWKRRRSCLEPCATLVMEAVQ